MSWDPTKESWPEFYRRMAASGQPISLNDEPTWCPDCGRMMPWKHKCWPTLKARIANRVIRILEGFSHRVGNWRDAEAVGTDEYMRIAIVNMEVQRRLDEAFGDERP